MKPNQEKYKVIEALLKCATECNICFSECLETEDVSMMSRCIELNTDCAEICLLTAGFLARSSESVETLLAVCAEICQACGDECIKHENEHCIRCASFCHQCAELCNA